MSRTGITIALGYVALGTVNSVAECQFEEEEELSTKGSVELASAIALRVRRLMDENDYPPTAIGQVVLGLPVPLEYPSKSCQSAYAIRHVPIQDPSIHDALIGVDLILLFKRAFREACLERAVIASACNTIVLRTLDFKVAKRDEGPTPLFVFTAGAGINACLVLEPMAGNPGYPGCFYNLELGNYSTDTFPVTSFDREVDVRSLEPGEYRLEKMTSLEGLAWYIKRVLISLLAHTHNEMIWQEKPDTLEFMERVHNRVALGEYIETTFLLDTLENQELVCLQTCLKDVFRRALRIMASFIDELIALCITMDKTSGFNGYSVAVTGKYTMVSWYLDHLEESLKEVMEENGREYRNVIELIELNHKQSAVDGAMYLGSLTQAPTGDI